jgi:hypothetical protein
MGVETEDSSSSSDEEEDGNVLNAAVAAAPTFIRGASNLMQKSTTVTGIAQIAKSAYQFHQRYTQKKLKKCITCGSKILPVDQTIHSRSFVNGVIGDQHERCANHMHQTIPVYFHNGKGYDLHHIMEKAMTRKDSSCQVLAKSLERIDRMQLAKGPISFTFMDTLSFLLGSLANLVKAVSHWRYTAERERNAKEAFPYMWFDSAEKLDATELPEDFAEYWNSMRMHYEDEVVIKQNWDELGFKTFNEYVKHYVLSDTTQLADVFESFRDTCFDVYKIDPSYFIGTPALTFNAAMFSTPAIVRVAPEFFQHKLQNSIRGGVSQVLAVSQWKVEGPNDYLLALDVNSLYSYCMSLRLPARFIKMGEGEYPLAVRDRNGGDYPTTHILEADFEYPVELHDRDRAFPLMPEHIEGRLMTTFWPKKNYVLTSDELNFYLNRGMKITKVHWWSVWTNEPVVKNYVEKNIFMRQEAVGQGNKVKAEAMKLLNNSLYGRFIMNPTKFKTTKVIPGVGGDEETEAEIGMNEELKYADNYYELKDNEDDEISTFFAQFQPKEVHWKYPQQLGFGVLGHAKVTMYKMVAMLQDIFGDNLTLIYTDTDSLYFGIRDWPIHPFVTLSKGGEWSRHFDFANGPEEYRTPIETQKKIGLWSDDFPGKRATEMIALRSKCYIVLFDDATDKMKAKGIGIRTATLDPARLPDSEKIREAQYRKALTERTTIYGWTETLRRKGPDISTQRHQKLALSTNDNKRATLADGINRIPFGYRGNQFSSYRDEIESAECEFLDSLQY